MKLSREMVLYLTVHNLPLQLVSGYLLGIAVGGDWLMWLGIFILGLWSVTRLWGDFLYFHVMRKDVVRSELREANGD